MRSGGSGRQRHSGSRRKRRRSTCASDARCCHLHGRRLRHRRLRALGSRRGAAAACLSRLVGEGRAASLLGSTRACASEAVHGRLCTVHMGGERPGHLGHAAVARRASWPGATACGRAAAPRAGARGHWRCRTRAKRRCSPRLGHAARRSPGWGWGWGWGWAWGRGGPGSGLELG